MRTIDVMVLGAGRMGSAHIASLRAVSERVLEPEYKIRLSLSAVDRDAQKRAALPADVRGFEKLETALAAIKPEIALMAFNDDQHLRGFQTLFALSPQTRAIFTEKPLTEDLAEAQLILDDLRARYVSMNTVINFSPVFDRLAEIVPSPEKLIGFEGVWGKDRTGDTRPSIGVPSESIHALSIITDIFGQRDIQMQEGAAVRGDLTAAARDVIYDMRADFKSPVNGLMTRFESSYVFDQQYRRVAAYYQETPETVLAVELDFDLRHEGRVADRLKAYAIDSAGNITPRLEEYPDSIFNGAAAGVLPTDKVTAFNALSILDYIAPEKLAGTTGKARLTKLDAALALQAEIDQINPDNTKLAVSLRDASPQALRAPRLKPLAELDNKGRLARLAEFGAFSAQQVPNAVPARKPQVSPLPARNKR